MENENLENQQDNNPPEKETGKEQPGWFQDFVDHYDVDKPQQGEILKGSILDIQDSSILLDVGFKRDAIIPGQDLEKVDHEIREKLSIGDDVYVSVIRTPLGDDDLLVSLSRGITHETWVKAEELAQKNELIELKVIDQNRGGLLVEYENLRGFIPNSHIPSIRRGTSTQKAGEIKADLIGKTLPVKPIEVDQKERRLVFSARVAQKDQRLKRLNEIEIGKIFKSRIVNVVDFGVFVDLEGVDGLVHKSELDWERIYNPSKLFKVGDEIEVKVVGVDIDKERISLSRKALLPNPWQKLADNYNIGDLVEGIVVSVLDFGAFVELQEGLQGLVHVSEIGYSNTEDKTGVVQKGDKVLVRIMGIDPRRERVSLSMRRVPVSEQMEWMMNLEDAEESMIQEGAESDLSDGDPETSPETDLTEETVSDETVETEDEVVEPEAEEKVDNAGEDLVVEESELKIVEDESSGDDELENESISEEKVDEGITEIDSDELDQEDTGE
jgi:small subunit ribosomal protein S1